MRFLQSEKLLIAILSFCRAVNELFCMINVIFQTAFSSLEKICSQATAMLQIDLLFIYIDYILDLISLLNEQS